MTKAISTKPNVAKDPLVSGIFKGFFCQIPVVKILRLIGDAGCACEKKNDDADLCMRKRAKGGDPEGVKSCAPLDNLSIALATHSYSKKMGDMIQEKGCTSNTNKKAVRDGSRR